MSIPNRMQSHWNEMQGFIKKEWPRLSSAAIKKMNGDYDLFIKYLRETYNDFPLEEARARDKIQRFLNSLEGV